MPPVTDLYDKYRPFHGYLRFAWKAMRTPENAARQAWMNRANDYLRLSSRPDLLPLHRRFAAVLARQKAEWPHYDYGEGYFYQSFSALGVSGLRSTEGRVQALNLKALVEGKTVLDIGCNAGFVSHSIAGAARQVTGLDVNPLLVEIARLAADHLRLSNTVFLASGFEDAPLTGPFDVVMSLANHSTYDGQTAHSLEAYFDRCHALLRPGGLLVFESHAPSFEGDKLDKVCDIIGARFDIRERRLLDYGTYLDRGRTLVLAQA
jgi:SAM-dependent methyltransferase